MGVWCVCICEGWEYEDKVCLVFQAQNTNLYSLPEWGYTNRSALGVWYVLISRSVGGSSVPQGLGESHICHPRATWPSAGGNQSLAHTGSINWVAQGPAKI